MGSLKRPGRTRSIRLTLASLFIIPLVTLVALWGFAASVTFADSIAKRNYDTQNTETGAPGQTVLVQLVQERLQSFVWLGSGRRSSHTPVEFQREHTDASVLAFRNAAAAAAGVMTPATKQSFSALLVQLGELPGIRDAIDFGAMDAPHAFQAYNGIVDAEFRFFDSQATINDIAFHQEAEANIQIGRALEMVGREAALVGEALAAHGQMDAADHNLFVQTVATQRFLESEALSHLNGRLAAPYRQLFASQTYTSFRGMENQIADSAPTGAPIPVNPVAWQSGVQPFLMAFNHAAGLGRQAVTKGLQQVGSGIRLRLTLAGGAGLLAVLISAFLLLRFGRRITRELVGLHEAARKLADERLPWVVSRLRHGEDVDVSAETPPLYPGKTSEIAKVAEAFSTVQRTAVEAAVGQAQLRKGVSQVFVNLARRSQSLLHRQLDMLDSMERRTADPEVLEDFFRLDHLTTRMRRHAEGLIILSGEVPGRGWRSPVRVLDVLRGAVAEVEDYVRVDVVSESRDAVVGTAVADIIHLLAELIENAVAFSPPNTRVAVSADRVGSGFAVEIEDRGLGIGHGELAEINKRLATPPEFDLADSDRLGLFVVGQLAARHQIRVSLVESPFGGTTAVVLMPHTIVVPEGDLDTFGADGHGDQAEGIRAGEGLTVAHAAAGIAPSEYGPADDGGYGSPTDDGGLRMSPALRADAADPQPLSAAPPTAWAPPAQAPHSWRDVPGTLDPWPDALEAPDAWPEAPGGTSAGSAARPRPGRTPGAAGTTSGAAGQANGEAATAGTYMGLPRRVRQASLAPQLRAVQAPDTDARTIGRAGTPAPRSPEVARALMTSLQRGWQRGRTGAAAGGEQAGTGADQATGKAADPAAYYAAEGTAYLAADGTMDEGPDAAADFEGGDV